MFSLIQRFVLPGAHIDLAAPLVFIHIPKTAGTSFRYSLERYFGKSRVVGDYGPNSARTTPWLKELVYGEQRCDSQQLQATFREKRSAVIAGHFAATKYQYLLGSANSAVAFIREPLARTVSEYLHRQRHAALSENFAQYIEQPYRINVQTKLLAGEERNIITGVTEEYEQSLKLINAKLGFTLKYTRKNEAPKGVVGDLLESLPRKTIERFYRLNHEDVGYYQGILKTVKEKEFVV